jgi:NAD(P)-dependent dehydrogenase (short-subunit alcohol dehydrogenase family)
MKDFAGRTAVITGGGSGFGREFAHLAAGLDMNVVIADVQQDALDTVKAELDAKGAPVLACRVDVSKGDQVEALAAEAEARFGAIHLVFNNAGVGSGGLIWENTVRDWEWVLGVNVWGVIHGLRAFVPRMLASAKADPTYTGHVVNTASMAGLLNAPNMGIYNVSKHAVVSMTETLYQDLALIEAPIGSSVVCPYFVPTGISQSHRNAPADVSGEAPTASKRAAQSMSAKAVGSGKVTAADFAVTVFQAISDDQFYVFSHPHALGNVETRMKDILENRNPSDPFAARPDVRTRLREAMSDLVAQVAGSANS